MKTKTLLLNIDLSSSQQWKEKDGKLTAPAIIVREGVLCGSDGCVLYEKETLKRCANRWEKIPVVIGHPVRNNQPISVNEDPGLIIGETAKPVFDPATFGIRVNLEIPLQKITDYQKERILQTKEVSMGVFADLIERSGTYKGKRFQKISGCMRPDHLALLPNEKGACSFEDGCGIRTNSSFEEKLLPPGINSSRWDIEEKLLPPGIRNICMDCD